MLPSCAVQYIMLTFVPANSIHHGVGIVNFTQILMSVQMIQTTVLRSVLTLMVPTLVLVIVDICQMMMEEHAMVC